MEPPSPQPQLQLVGSKKLSPLRWITERSPTNHNMLLFRTQNRCVVLTQLLV
jgi:hypothetical protein